MERDRSSESSDNLDEDEQETIQEKVDKMYERLDRERFARLSFLLMEIEDETEI